MKTTSVALPLTLAAVAAAAPQASSGAAGGLASLGSLINGLSSQCTSYFGTLVLDGTNPLNQCLSLGDAVTMFTAAGNSSLVPVLDTYLSKDICGKAPCTAAQLDQAKSQLNQGCSADFSKNDGANIPTYFQELLQEYWTVRDAACLSNSATNQNCVIETAYQTQNATNYQLSLSNVLALSNDTAKLEQLTQSLVQNKTLACSDCSKAILSSVLKDLGVNAAQLNSTLSSAAGMSSANGGSLTSILPQYVQQCGTSFFDGQMPSSVKNTSTAYSSSGSGSGSSNAAASTLQNGVAATLLGFVAAGAMLLA